MGHSRYLAGRETPLRDLPFSALRASILDGYGIADLRTDVLAGIVVGVVALPLSMALAIAVGVPPQYGLYTAIVSGAVIALLGGSRFQVSGPTAAFIVILSPIYARFGMEGLLLSGMLAGAMLIAMALARAGKLIEFIPGPVTTGFTSGIAVVIATMQLKDLLGLKLAARPEHYVDWLTAMWDARGTVAPGELLVGVVTFALLRLWPRVSQRVPAPVVALPVAALLAIVLGRLVPGFSVATIASRFESVVHGQVVHGIPQLPPSPVFPWNQPGPDGQPLALSLTALRAILPGAFAVAILGAIESLLSAVVADGMKRTRHDPDAELLAQGIGNVVGPFFGAIPATGAIARTATNIRAGARSPVAAVVHAITVLVAVLALAPALGYLPMAAMAALLLQVAWNMSEAKHFVHIVRVAPKSDVWTLLTVFFLTVVFDMVVGVSVGLMLASLLFMRRMATVTQTRVFEPEAGQAVGRLPAGVVVYDISGALFFGAAQKAMGVISVVSGGTHTVVLRMDDVQVMDVTGLVALETAVDTLRSQGRLAVLVGARIQPRQLLMRAGFGKRTDVVLCDDLGEALEVAEAHGRRGSTAGGPPRPAAA